MEFYYTAFTIFAQKNDGIFLPVMILVLKNTTALFWDATGQTKHGAVLLIHLKEEQTGQLFDLITIRHAIIAHDAAVVPVCSSGKAFN